MSGLTASPAELAAMSQVLKGWPAIEFAALVGSRAEGSAKPGSDWDIALRWQRGGVPMQRLESTEALRVQLARALSVAPESIDLIDLAQARLAMRALVAEHGHVLLGAHSLPWMRFLQTTWAEVEEFHWRQQHAA